MLFAAVLLLVFFAVSPPVECHNISRRSFVLSVPTEVTSKVLDANKDVAYQAFGLILHKKKATSKAPKKPKIEPKIVCEGVLLSSRVVLTTNDCRPDDFDTTLMYFRFMNEKIFFDEKAFHQAGDYDLIHLPKAPTKPPHSYPFVSWFTGTNSNNHQYGVREEFVRERKVYLSSWLAHDTNDYISGIKGALRDCYFTLKDKLIALLCKKTNVCDGTTVLPGSAFFTFTKTASIRIVSITGLVSLRNSGKFCWEMNKPGDYPLTKDTPDKPDCSEPYVCGRRFTEESVKTILAEARKLDNTFKFHEFMPSETKSRFFFL